MLVSLYRSALTATDALRIPSLLASPYSAHTLAFEYTLYCTTNSKKHTLKKTGAEHLFCGTHVRMKEGLLVFTWRLNRIYNSIVFTWTSSETMHVVTI